MQSTALQYAGNIALAGLRSKADIGIIVIADALVNMNSTTAGAEGHPGLNANPDYRARLGGLEPAVRHEALISRFDQIVQCQA